MTQVQACLLRTLVRTSFFRFVEIAHAFSTDQVRRTLKIQGLSFKLKGPKFVPLRIPFKSTLGGSGGHGNGLARQSPKPHTCLLFSWFHRNPFLCSAIRSKNLRGKASNRSELIPAEPYMEENKNRDDELGSVALSSLLDTINDR